jgi:hypothetical protein
MARVFKKEDRLMGISGISYVRDDDDDDDDGGCGGSDVVGVAIDDGAVVDAVDADDVDTDVVDDAVGADADDAVDADAPIGLKIVRDTSPLLDGAWKCNKRKALTMLGCMK